MRGLHVLLQERSEEVMVRWQMNVQGSIVPESLPVAELRDHLPVFLLQVIDALRADAEGDSHEVPAEVKTATTHGEQRLRLGFSLDAVVREYGAMQDAILAIGRDAGVAITFREAQVVFDATINGIASAVSEYARQRDAELYRQHNEHIAFLAHELRNPLASAAMAMTILEQRGFIPAAERASVALSNSLSKIRELVDHALEEARAASGVELRPELIAISRVLKAVEAATTADADARGVAVSFEVERDADLLLDRRLIHSAFSNVVRNAIKFTPKGGHVDVRSHLQGERVVVEVEDSCGGLPDGEVEQAFAPFVRLGNDQTQKGFGLGLAIAKQAVDAHGGVLRVQNLPGKGCIFIFELQTAAPDASVDSVAAGH
jgi:signal transduction histidine kinase